MKHGNFGRILPVAVVFGVIQGIVFARLEGAGIIGESAEKLLCAFVGFFATGWFCVQIRRGRFPWFAQNDKHKVIVWFERHFPFLGGPKR